MATKARVGVHLDTTTIHGACLASGTATDEVQMQAELSMDVHNPVGTRKYFTERAGRSLVAVPEAGHAPVVVSRCAPRVVAQALALVIMHN